MQAIHRNPGRVLATLERNAVRFPHLSPYVAAARAAVTTHAGDPGRAYHSVSVLADHTRYALVAERQAKHLQEFRSVLAPYAHLVPQFRAFMAGSNENTQFDAGSRQAGGFTDGPGDVVVWQVWNTNNTVSYYLPDSGDARAMAAALHPFCALLGGGFQKGFNIPLAAFDFRLQ
jgi:hypothetical protein